MAVNTFHVEAWGLPLDTTTRIVARVPFIQGSFMDPLSDQSGRGALTVPADWDRLTEVIDPDTNTGSLLVIFQDNTYIGAFFASTMTTDHRATEQVTITGKHVASVLAHGTVLPFDYPLRPTVDPDWIWGNDVNVNGFQNGGLEDDPESPSPWKAVNDVETLEIETDLSKVRTGTQSLRIVTTGLNGGAKQRVNNITNPKQYTFTGWVYHELGSTEDFQIRVFALDPFTPKGSDTVPVPTATWTRLSVTAILDSDDISVRLRCLTAIGEFWLDDLSLVAGSPATTWGDITLDLILDLKNGHNAETSPYEVDALGFLSTSWGTVQDSASQAWDNGEIEYRARRGKKLSLIFADGVAGGYEYECMFNPATGNVDMDLFNPYDWATRTGGVGTNRTGTGVPELNAQSAVVAGPISRSVGGPNRIQVEGDEGRYAVRRDTTAQTGFGTRMAYRANRNILAGDSGMLGKIAARYLDESVEPQIALQTVVRPTGVGAVPYRDFRVGDTYPMNFPGVIVGAKRCVRIRTSFTETEGVYTIDWDATSYTAAPVHDPDNQVVIDPLWAFTEAMRRLMERVDEFDVGTDLSFGDIIVGDEATGDWVSYLSTMGA